jgi:hypothetical protein
MTIECNCPICGSRSTKSLPIIYESGQRMGRSTRNSLWASTSGRVWAGRSVTESHSASLIAANAAPPGTMPWLTLLIPLIVMVVIFNWSMWLVPVVMFSVAILYGGSDAYIQTRQAIENWEKSFRCLRCGAIFIPTAAIETLPVLTDVVPEGKTATELNRQNLQESRYAK